MLKEINTLILTARKGGDKFKAKALSLVKAELINNDKSKKPQKEMQIVQGYAKKLEKAAHAFKNTDKHDDLVKEMKIVSELMPTSLPREEIAEHVAKFLSANPDLPNPGIAIKALKGTLGDYNGNYISSEVMSQLGK